MTMTTEPLEAPWAEASGKELRAARKVLGLTQGELADLFGCDRGTIHRWEVGKESPIYPGMVRLALDALVAR